MYRNLATGQRPQTSRPHQPIGQTHRRGRAQPSRAHRLVPRGRAHRVVHETSGRRMRCAYPPYDRR